VPLAAVSKDGPKTPLRASLGQGLDDAEVAFDQCLFLGAGPALDLPLDGDGVGDVGKVLGPYERDRETLGPVAAVFAVIVLGDAARRAEPT
jgi:hypothetical protein